MRVGSLEVLPLHDGTVYLDPVNIGFGKSLADWGSAGHSDLLTADGKLEISVGGFLVRGSGDRLVVIDTGFGSDFAVDDPPIFVPPGGYGGLVPSLQSYGVEPTEVTDVILTHLHADHVCGTVQGESRTFPNATYRCHVDDWTFFASPNAPDSLGMGNPPLSRLTNLIGRLEPWDAAGEVLPGIYALPTPGHTPGSTVMIIDGGVERAFMLGDVAHCVVELLEPEWSGLADFDTEVALRNREALVREIEGDASVRVTGGHFPGLRFGRILTNSDKRRSFAFSD